MNNIEMHAQNSTNYNYIHSHVRNDLLMEEWKGTANTPKHTNDRVSQASHIFDSILLESAGNVSTSTFTLSGDCPGEVCVLLNWLLCPNSVALFVSATPILRLQITVVMMIMVTSAIRTRDVMDTPKTVPSVAAEIPSEYT